MVLMENNKDGQNAYIVVAYGRHIVRGRCPLFDVSGNIVTLLQILGEGEWEAVESIFYDGLPIDLALCKFHPGTLSTGDNDPIQGVDEFFSSARPYSGTTYVRVPLPAGIGDAKNLDGFVAIARTAKVADYDASGNQIGFGYSANPARVAADLIVNRSKLSKSVIDWVSWVAWRNYCDDVLTISVNPNAEGMGLRGSYYNGYNFETFVLQRIDEVINFAWNYSSPASGIGANQFSIRWEGRIKFDFAETYTFKSAHDDKFKLVVNGITIINSTTAETNTGTFAATSAGQTVDIIIEYGQFTDIAKVDLQWSSASLPLEVVKRKNLYSSPSMIKRYEAHVFFAQPTTLVDALAVVCLQSNSTYQLIGDKYVFSAIEQRTVTANLTESDFVEGTLEISRSDRRNLPNRATVSYRNLDSTFIEIEKDPPFIDRQDLQAIAGRTISQTVFDLFNERYDQARRVLENYERFQLSNNLIVDFRGMPRTFGLLPGDLITLTETTFGFNQKQFIVIEASDDSPESTSDERAIRLQEWS